MRKLLILYQSCQYKAKTTLLKNNSFSDSPIFIVGTGRSGTTLMRKILSAHSRISITPETHFMKRVDKRGDINGSPKDFDAFWEEYTSWIRFTYLDIDPDYCLRLIDNCGERSFKNIFQAVITAYKEKNGKAREGEKSPSHTRYISYLLKWFPRGRVIIMQRDPRAVVASKLNTPWVLEQLTPVSLRRGFIADSRIQHLILGANSWTNVFKHIVPEWEEDPRVLIVTYEQLCHDPEKEVRSICGFIGEEFEMDMLSDHKRKDESSSNDKPLDPKVKQWRSHHKNTENPISTAALTKWKKNLSKSEAAMVEALCRKQMIERGYVPSYSAIASLVLARAIQIAGICEEKSRNTYRWARGKFT